MARPSDLPEHRYRSRCQRGRQEDKGSVTAAAAVAAVGIGPVWPGPGPRSGGNGEIMKGHLATQVNALIQSEKNPAGEAFYERKVEADEEPAVTAVIIQYTARFGGSEMKTQSKKYKNVPPITILLKCIFYGAPPD